MTGVKEAALLLMKRRERVIIGISLAIDVYS